MPARIGAAPSRFCAFAAAAHARGPGRAARIVPAGAERAFLAPLPVALLRARPEVVARGARREDLCTVLERLGVRTLGELAALARPRSPTASAGAGLRARELALGRDTPLRPRAFRRASSSSGSTFPRRSSGPQLERTLELLIDRLLARPERRGRSLRKLRPRRALRRAGDMAARGRDAPGDRRPRAAAPRARAPARRAAGADRAAQPRRWSRSARRSPTSSASRGPDEHERRKRLGEALRQTRAAAGPESLLRVLEVDPASRIPERRVVLTPFPE